MAVLPPTKGSKRRPSFRGNILQDTTRGVERTRIWPGPRGVLQTPAQKEQNEWFRQVNWAFKYMAPKVQAAYANATKETSLYPRDLLSIIASNGLVARVMESGKVAYPMPYMQAVSQSLDTIGQVPGQMLIRGPTWWQPTTQGATPGRLSTRAIILTDKAVPATEIPVTWDAAPFDEIGAWSIDHPTKLIIPANVHRVIIGASIDFFGGTAGNIDINIRKNGIRFAGQSEASGFAGTRNTITSGPVDVVEGDEFTYTIGRSSAGAMTFHSPACGFWMMTT